MKKNERERKDGAESQTNKYLKTFIKKFNFSYTKRNKILLYLVERYTIKMDIIWILLLKRLYKTEIL